MKEKTELTQKEMCEANKIIKEKTGYSIRNKIILQQIFRRSSSASETGQNSNEIFEFIGDQVLSFFLVKCVAKRCGSIGLRNDYCFRIHENRFTMIKQALVNNEALSKIIEEWDIAKYLILSKSDIKNEVINGVKVKADLFEAILGAITISCDWNPEILEMVVSKALNLDTKLNDLIKTDYNVRSFKMDNAITTLKEMAEKGQCTMPYYDYMGDKPAYDYDGIPYWVCICTVCNDETGYRKSVIANSKKDAKKAAAYLVLCELLKMQNEYGPNSITGLWIYKEGNLLPETKK